MKSVRGRNGGETWGKLFPPSIEMIRGSYTFCKKVSKNYVKKPQTLNSTKAKNKKNID